jgi:hypothetical protein
MIEFFPEDHSYQVDGVLAPSVTTLIGSIWIPNKYAGISKSVLRKAADYGNRVHELIENAEGEMPEWYERKSEEGRALKNYLRIKDAHNISIQSCEQPVAYIADDGLPLYAGMYDMIGTVNGKIALIDIKTTAKFDRKYLAYQLTLYKMAMEQMDESLKIEEGYCLHVPKKGFANLIRVDFLDSEKLKRDITLWRSQKVTQ